jgi:hypothetical protein
LEEVLKERRLNWGIKKEAEQRKNRNRIKQYYSLINMGI